jgi:hypothetical protein
MKVAIISIGLGGNFKLDKMIDLAVIPSIAGLPLGYPKSLDFLNGNLLCGLRNGSIVEVLQALDAEPKEPRVVVQAHFEGEAWGLEAIENDYVISCGDDNRVMLFNAKERQFVRGGKVSDKAMKDGGKKSTASTMSKMAVNK